MNLNGARGRLWWALCTTQISFLPILVTWNAASRQPSALSPSGLPELQRALSPMEYPCEECPHLMIYQCGHIKACHHGPSQDNSEGPFQFQRSLWSWLRLVECVSQLNRSFFPNMLLFPALQKCWFQAYSIISILYSKLYFGIFQCKPIINRLEHLEKEINSEPFAYWGRKILLTSESSMAVGC